MERNTYRKVRERQGSVEVNLGKTVQHSDLEVGEKAKVEVITSGRNAGSILIEPKED